MIFNPFQRRESHELVMPAVCVTAGLRALISARIMEWRTVVLPAAGR